ncbi:MAG: cell wall-binding repeat-containing protein [Bacillus sp. (in: firmicutes)]
MTEKDTIPTVVQNEINRLKPTKAIIVGGTPKVSTIIEEKLKSLNVTTIQRYSGDTRYSTATAVANTILPEKTASGEGIISDAPNKNINVTAVIVNGFSETYMMDIASVAVRNELPILLTNGETLTSSVQDFLKSHTQISSFILLEMRVI